MGLAEYVSGNTGHGMIVLPAIVIDKREMVMLSPCIPYIPCGFARPAG
jgi:hypothetical protein